MAMLTFNETQASFREQALKRDHDHVAMTMLRGEPDADGKPITQETLKAIAEKIRADFPYEKLS